MFDPSGLRIVLAELLLRRSDDGAVVIENDCAGTGRALIEGH
jgi:hypothetical protein